MWVLQNSTPHFPSSLAVSGIPHPPPAHGQLSVESAPLSPGPQSNGEACDFASKAMKVPSSVGTTSLGQDSLRSWSCCSCPKGLRCGEALQCSMWKLEWEHPHQLPAVSHPIIPKQGCLGLWSYSGMVQKLFVLSHEAFSPESRAPVWEEHDLSTPVGCFPSCPSALNLSHYPWVIDTLTLLLSMTSSQRFPWFLMQIGSRGLPHHFFIHAHPTGIPM